MGIIHLKQLISQKGYEKIKKVVRRDKIIALGTLAFYSVLFLAPVVLYFLFKGYLPTILAHNVWHPVLVLGFSIYYASCWIFLFAAFLDYYLDTWIITNDRLLNIEQEGVFARTISELDLYRIQDATSEIKGILPSLFGYGNVYIQTAGEKARFVLEQVPNPHELRKKIMDLAEEDRKYHKKSI
ncbi:PH domain-containing protein [Patescibacteria group bacterium]|nr:PH domain-containing protein [Patescibacteria group bacterium]